MNDFLNRQRKNVIDFIYSLKSEDGKAKNVIYPALLIFFLLVVVVIYHREIFGFLGEHISAFFEFVFEEFGFYDLLEKPEVHSFS